MKLEFAGISDTGKKRKTNQDAYCMYQDGDAGLFAVADGMGGHSDGERASRTVIAYLSDWWHSFSPISFGYEFQKMLLSLEQVIESANRDIYMIWNQQEICGTTVTVLFIYKSLYGIIYAGDSRCYLFQGRKWKQVTIDEIWENQPSFAGKERINKEHPNRGKLVNAIGIRETVHYRAVTDSIASKAVFLLCSDGLYKFCSDRFIKRCMKEYKNGYSMEKTIKRLLNRVYQYGAGDNVSVIIVKWFEE